MRKRISLHAGVLTAVIAASVLAGEAASGVGGLAAAASPAVAACSELSGIARVEAGRDGRGARALREEPGQRVRRAQGLPTLANGSVTSPSSST